MSKVAAPFRFTKNIALTGGIPGTGINWHTLVNMPARAYASAGLTHPIKGITRAAKALYYDINPKAATKALDKNPEAVADAIKSGLVVGAEGFWKGKDPVGVVEKVEESFEAKMLEK